MYLTLKKEMSPRDKFKTADELNYLLKSAPYCNDILQSKYSTKLEAIKF